MSATNNGSTGKASLNNDTWWTHLSEAIVLNILIIPLSDLHITQTHIKKEFSMFSTNISFWEDVDYHGLLVMNCQTQNQVLDIINHACPIKSEITVQTPNNQMRA